MDVQSTILQNATEWKLNTELLYKVQELIDIRRNTYTRSYNQELWQLTPSHFFDFGSTVLACYFLSVT